jgi:hypothetical protein
LKQTSCATGKLPLETVKLTGMKISSWKSMGNYTLGCVWVPVASERNRRHHALTADAEFAGALSRGQKAWLAVPLTH